MAYRGLKGSDPFTLKTTRNERFAQMSKQEQIIEQKKREIQAKLEEQKQKQAEDSSKKSYNSSSSKTKINTSIAAQLKNNKKAFWKTDQKWKKDTATSKTPSVNIFSNDGSFLDQFKKLSGVKDVKGAKGDSSAEVSATKDCKLQPDNKCDDRIDSDVSEFVVNEEEPKIKEEYQETSHEPYTEKVETPVFSWQEVVPIPKEEPVWIRQDLSIPLSPVSVPRGSSPYSPTRETTPESLTPKPLPLQTLQQTVTLQTHYPPAPTITLVAPPPPLHSVVTQPPPQAQFISYTTPPPTLHSAPLHSIPPPSPVQPQSILPPPTLVQTIPPPSVRPPLTIPPPAPIIQHPISTPPPHLLQQPPPLIQTNIPPPNLIPIPNLATVPAHAVPPPVMPPITAVVRPPAVLQSALPVTAPLLPQAVPPPVVAPVPVPLQCHIVPTGNGVCSTDISAAEEERDADEAREHLARTVAQCGDDIEDIIKCRNPDDVNIWFLHNKESLAYQEYRQLVEKYRAEERQNVKEENAEMTVKSEEIQNVEASEYGNMVSLESMSAVESVSFKREDVEEDENSRTSEGKRSGDDSDEGTKRKRKKRRSRWAPEDTKVPIVEVPVGTPVVPIVGTPAIPGVSTGGSPMLSKVTRTDPALIQYAMRAFGTTNLSEEDWKKAEDHYKLNLLYQDMMRKREELDRLARSGKFKYEYDSDEETEGGTWEHKLRTAEMEATQRWAEELTKKAEGKHHIGDFLPPDELERFLEKYNALKEGREPDLSDYKEFKLTQDNVGFQMLQKLGWSEGQGLGSDGSGIVDPVNKATSRPANQGLGVDKPDDVTKEDDEYDAYRKRMMLAYRFRPNPLNNPRRPYY